MIVCSIVVLGVMVSAAADTFTPADRERVNAPGEYRPPAEPRSEARYGDLYMALREAEEQAGNVADRKEPQPDPVVISESPASLKREMARLDRWQAIQDRELAERLRRIAARERVTVDELEDLREEGDVRMWFAPPAKRANRPKTEARIQSELNDHRETLRLIREKKRADQSRRRRK